MIVVGGAIALVAVIVVLKAVGERKSAGTASREGGGESMANMAIPGEPLGRSQEGMEMRSVPTGGSILLSPGQVSSFGITFGGVEVRDLTRTIRTTGYVDVDETRLRYISPKFGGWVEKLHVNFTGQPVERGQPLLDVYSPDLVAAQEELLLAFRMVESLGEDSTAEATAGTRELLESVRRRLAYWDVSEEQIEQVLESGEARRTLTIYSPVSGIVMEKNVVLGQYFEPGRSIYMIADLSRVWVNGEIFESDLPYVREGMPVEISVSARPGETLTGTVEYLYPTLSDRTRSVRARIGIPNPRGGLKPGMYATARLTATLDEALTIPSSAVLETGERAVAFVDLGGGRLMPQEVRIGARGEGYVEVLGGLEPGQRVVTSPQFLLDSESNLAEVMQAMVAQMNLSDLGNMSIPGMEIPEMKMPGMGD
jgi:Cu(I)/Ag(I) efflux system membrane fusion protein